MAGVVSFICQSSIAEFGGMVNWTRLQESMKLKYEKHCNSIHLFSYFANRFSDSGVHPTVLAMLEYFEVIYQMKAIHGVEEAILPGGSDINSEQMFFVPSLLPVFSSQSNHISFSYWSQIEPK